MFISIIKMVLPVLLVIGLGSMCKQKKWLSLDGMQGIKAVVSRFALPAVLFNAFMTADYSSATLITFLIVYVSLGLALAAGFFLRRVNPKFAKFMPFLLTGFEGGMLGYSLFGLLYGAAETHVFAMADMGQTFFAFTMFLSTLTIVNGQKASPASIAKTMLTNPAGLAMICGIILGTTGLGALLMSSPAGDIVSSMISFLSAPTSMLILLVVGYELSFNRTIMRPVVITAALRLAIMAVLCAVCSLVVFSITPFDKKFFTALLLGFSLPAPFIIPLYADVNEHGEYISTTLSVTTLVSVVLFIAIAAYSLA